MHERQTVHWEQGMFVFIVLSCVGVEALEDPTLALAMFTSVCVFK